MTIEVLWPEHYLGYSAEITESTDLSEANTHRARNKPVRLKEAREGNLSSADKSDKINFDFDRVTKYSFNFKSTQRWRKLTRTLRPVLSKYLSMLTILFCMWKIHKQTACDFSQKHKYLVSSFILNYFPFFHETRLKDNSLRVERKYFCSAERDMQRKWRFRVYAPTIDLACRAYSDEWIILRSLEAHFYIET